MAGSGFVLVEVDRRRRGRPGHRRRVVFEMRDGCRLIFSSNSNPDVVQAVIMAVLRSWKSQC